MKKSLYLLVAFAAMLVLGGVLFASAETAPANDAQSSSEDVFKVQPMAGGCIYTCGWCPTTHRACTGYGACC